MVDELPNTKRKGRAAVSNATGRYECEIRVATHDGWAMGEDDDLPPLKTTIHMDTVKSAFAWNQSPDIPFDRTINPYRGCEHGCIYCYARATHAYLNLSPGLDFETQLFVKKGLAEALERDLRKPSYKVAPVMIGANTDGYQPIERERKATREVLEVLQAYRHPLVVITKNYLVTRDIDILAEMARDNLVTVAISLTTLDHKLANQMEPRASTPGRRLKAMEELSKAGIPVAVFAAPMIPTLNDHELESILEAAANAGASMAAYILVRLPLELKTLFHEWLETNYPTKAKRVMNVLQQSRDGQLYVHEFHTRMTGSGVHAKLLNQRYHLACKKLGLTPAEPGKVKLNCDDFTRPVRVGDQLSLL